jgi:hypothetical protein
MKCSTQTAIALGAGYVLGRRRKMRMTTLLAVGAMTGGLGGLGGTVLRRGVKMLGSTDALGKVAPQLGELADTLRDDLLDAGKAAASAAVTSRLESLTDSLHERAEMVRDPEAAAGRAGEAARSGASEATRRVRRRGRGSAADEETDEGRDEEEPDSGETIEPDDYEPDADEPDADEPEAEEPEPAPRRRRTTTSRRRSPVVRAGR